MIPRSPRNRVITTMVDNGLADCNVRYNNYDDTCYTLKLRNGLCCEFRECVRDTNSTFFSLTTFFSKQTAKWEAALFDYKNCLTPKLYSVYSDHELDYAGKIKTYYEIVLYKPNTDDELAAELNRLLGLSYTLSYVGWWKYLQLVGLFPITNDKTHSSVNLFNRIINQISLDPILYAYPTSDMEHHKKSKNSLSVEYAISRPEYLTAEQGIAIGDIARLIISGDFPNK